MGVCNTDTHKTVMKNVTTSANHGHIFYTGKHQWEKQEALPLDGYK